MFQRFLRWLLSNILEDIKRENDGVRHEIARAKIAAREDTEKVQKDSQGRLQNLSDRLISVSQQNESDFAALRTAFEAGAADLRAESHESSSSLQSEIKLCRELSETVALRLREISEEFKTLRDASEAQIESLLNTVSYLTENTKLVAASVDVVETQWGEVQQGLIDQFAGMKAEFRQDFIKMQWNISRIEKEPTQLREDVTELCVQAIETNRSTMLQELQRIGKFNEVVYRKLLELDGSAPASLYGRIRLPMKQGDPVIYEPPATETPALGINPTAYIIALDSRLSALEQVINAPMPAPVKQEPPVKGNVVTWSNGAAHFGNKFDLGE